MNQNNKAMKNTTCALMWQFIKFGLVGAFNTVVSYTIYSLCYHLFNFNAQISNVFAFIISVFSAFLLQSLFVFNNSEKNRAWWWILLKTYASYAFTGLILTAFLIWLWLDVINLGQYLSPITRRLMSIGITINATDLAASIVPFINMMITIPMNFLINKFWTYRKSTSNSKKPPNEANKADDSSTETPV